jgi:hypothetical protein
MLAVFPPMQVRMREQAYRIIAPALTVCLNP